MSKKIRLHRFLRLTAIGHEWTPPRSQEVFCWLIFSEHNGTHSQQIRLADWKSNSR